jgi:mRNA-degrading endonuclease RelE of RelBE toxin-antitoxin system
MSHIIPIFRKRFTAFPTTQGPTGYKMLKGREAYRIRVADYRIIYEIFDDVLLVDVIDLGHRKDIYK